MRLEIMVVFQKQEPVSFQEKLERQLVWEYFNSTGRCYKLVKPRDGGGIRYLKINGHATKLLDRRFKY